MSTVNVSRRSKLNKPTIFAKIIFVFLALYVFSWLFVYVWGVLTSLKSVSDFRSNMLGLPKGFPWQWQWNNYLVAYRSLNVTITKQGVRYVVSLPQMILNSVLYSLVGGFAVCMWQWATSYVISRFRDLRICRFLFQANIILMLIPTYGTLPAALQVYKSLNLHDTWLYVFINTVTWGGGNLLIWYGFFSGIGKEYSEAASIDGAGNFTTMFRIIFPASAQMFFVYFLIAVIARWNDYMTMVIWLPSKPTLAYGIYMFSTSTENAISWPPLQITACMILALPIIALFLIFQDKIMSGIRVAGLKG